MAGSAQADVLCLDEPISFWGGVDPTTGEIVDRRHPQAGTCVGGKIVVMERSRGSSSASSVLAEMIRLGTGPAGLILGDPDPILVLGALVADELYGRRIPVLAASLDVIAQVSTSGGVRIGMKGDVAEV